MFGVSIGVAGACGERVAGGGDERVEAGAVDGDDQAGVGAELAGAHGQRADEGACRGRRRGWSSAPSRRNTGLMELISA